MDNLNIFLFFVPESKLYTYLIALHIQKKNKKKNKKKNIYIYGFRRFHGLLIHSLVTPKNMEISSQNFGDQSLKIQIVQKCYLSGQIWNPIPSLKETAVVRFELLQTKTKHYFYSG